MMAWRIGIYGSKLQAQGDLGAEGVDGTEGFEGAEGAEPRPAGLVQQKAFDAFPSST